MRSCSTGIAADNRILDTPLFTNSNCSCVTGDWSCKAVVTPVANPRCHRYDAFRFYYPEAATPTSFQITAIKSFRHHCWFCSRTQSVWSCIDNTGWQYDVSLLGHTWIPRRSFASASLLGIMNSPHRSDPSRDSIPSNKSRNSNTNLKAFLYFHKYKIVK